MQRVKETETGRAQQEGQMCENRGAGWRQEGEREVRKRDRRREDKNSSAWKEQM